MTPREISQTERLIGVARTLNRRASARKPLPGLLFFTDPTRTPDPAKVMARLPRGSGVVFRTFGAPDGLDQARRLRALAEQRGLIFLIGADAGLAAAVRADGVHLPERGLGRALAIRRRHPAWLITGAAHSPRALAEARRLGLDAAVLSPVFASRSPSAGAPLGRTRFEAWTRAAGLPVYALGGISGRTAPGLRTSRAVGLAAVEGLMP